MSSCRFLSFPKFFDIEKERIYQYGDINHVSGSEKDIFDHVVSLALKYVLVDCLTLEFYREAGQTYIFSLALAP